MSFLFKSRQKTSVNQNFGFARRIVIRLLDHLRQALNSLGELWRVPFASLMTIGVLGFSLTLPSTLYILVKNTEKISAQWQQASEISLFLNTNVTDATAQRLVDKLSLYPEVSSVSYISKQRALEEFQQLSGLGEALNYLDENPLPSVVLVVPTSKHSSPTAAGLLLDKLIKEREVDIGKLDIEWLERLYALLSITKKLVNMLSLLLFFAVVLIIGNTIRLNIMNKKDEILVMKLVGATDSFIQRPFLYTGFWFGLLGGLMAWLTVAIILLWVDASLDEFMQLYQINFDITGLDGDSLLVMISTSIGLGLVGSALSVKRYVDEIEPK